MTYPEHIRQEAADRMNKNATQTDVFWGAQDMSGSVYSRALCQCIEELHAAKSELSKHNTTSYAHLEAEIAELVTGVREYIETDGGIEELERFLAKYEPKPDPLVEAMSEAMCGIPGEDYTQCAADLRAELSKRGLEIREIGA